MKRYPSNHQENTLHAHEHQTAHYRAIRRRLHDKQPHIAKQSARAPLVANVHHHRRADAVLLPRRTRHQCGHFGVSRPHGQHRHARGNRRRRVLRRSCRVATPLRSHHRSPRARRRHGRRIHHHARRHHRARFLERSRAVHPLAFPPGHGLRHRDDRLRHGGRRRATTVPPRRGHRLLRAGAGYRHVHRAGARHVPRLHRSCGEPLPGIFRRCGMRARVRSDLPLREKPTRAARDFGLPTSMGAGTSLLRIERRKRCRRSLLGEKCSDIDASRRRDGRRSRGQHPSRESRELRRHREPRKPRSSRRAPAFASRQHRRTPSSAGDHSP